MPAKEYKPIDTTTVVLLELCPDGRWVAVHKAGASRLTVGVKMLDRLAVGAISRVEKGEERAEEIGKRCIASVQIGAVVLDSMAIPFGHFLSLVNRVWEMSTTGEDPFAEAPAESSP